MKLKAKDTLHVSSVKADNIAPGEVFEVSDDMGRQLVERGLATEESGKASRKSDDTVREDKAEPAPLNKIEQAPANKSDKRKGK